MQAIIFQSISKCYVSCLEYIRGMTGYKPDNNLMDLENMHCDIHFCETKKMIFNTENQDLLG